MPIVTIATAPAVATGKVTADTKITVTTKTANTTSVLIGFMLIGFIYFTSFKFGIPIITLLTYCHLLDALSGASGNGFVSPPIETIISHSIRPSSVLGSS